MHMYADNMTDSMRNALEETDRRREKQIAYNTERGIDPQPLRKRISDITAVLAREEADTAALLAGRSTSDGSRRRSPTPNLRREGIGAGERTSSRRSSPTSTSRCCRPRGSSSSSSRPASATSSRT
ncbi:hypothetical protein GCM10025881_38890 [Pseudolysinimonas kribbensis]|uniref:UvrB YAD/RRR-motif-containing domain-containing protein n=1 Tax=Pseudolysinimonas kribbensis TaxID=433641 RepID=A0ABQ6K8N5_9MICO|nr:hypothetical protein GCM10025881_38890 [Pseudolysinimonas kribbensis]